VPYVGYDERTITSGGGASYGPLLGVRRAWGFTMLVRRVCVVAIGVAGFAAISTGPASAGEIKGPPGTVASTNTTGALDHARSACAASGLNDLDPTSGQNASQVQTAADSWKYYGLPKGSPGTFGLCRGNAE